MTKIVFSLPLLLLFAYLLKAHNIGEECQIFDDTQIKCTCITSEEFLLPEDYNYENVTSVEVSSCRSAYLHFSSLTEANKIEELIVHNISDVLKLDLFITSTVMKKMKLSHVGRIPVVTHETFISLESIEFFEIENTKIESFEEQFDNIRVTNFILKNVTVIHMGGLNLAEKGNTLKIINCDFQDVMIPFNLAYFFEVEIINSKFELTKPGHVSIEGAMAILTNNVFINSSINIVTVKGIAIKSTCGDGSSSLRLSSTGKIESFDNRLPTEIIYTTNGMHNDTEFSVTRNNTVCKAGFCRCQVKNTGQIAYLSINHIFLTGILLLTTFYLRWY